MFSIITDTLQKWNLSVDIIKTEFTKVEKGCKFKGNHIKIGVTNGRQLGHQQAQNNLQQQLSDVQLIQGYFEKKSARHAAPDSTMRQIHLYIQLFYMDANFIITNEKAFKSKLRGIMHYGIIPCCISQLESQRKRAIVTQGNYLPLLQPIWQYYKIYEVYKRINSLLPHLGQ